MMRAGRCGLNYFSFFLLGGSTPSLPNVAGGLPRVYGHLRWPPSCSPDRCLEPLEVLSTKIILPPTLAIA